MNEDDIVDLPVSDSEKPERLLKADFYAAHAKLRKMAAKKYSSTDTRKKKQLEELEKRFSHWLTTQYDLESRNRSEQSEDEKFYHGQENQWDNFARRQPYFRDIRIPLIASGVDFVTANLAAERIEGKINTTNRTIHSTSETTRAREHVAKEFDMRLKAAFTQINFDNLRAEIIEQAHRAGCGYLHYGLRRLSNGTLKLIAKVPHWSNVYWDTTSPQLHTSRYAFVLERTDLTRAIAMFPERTKRLKEMGSERTLRTTLGEWFDKHLYNVTAVSPYYGYNTREDYSGADGSEEYMQSVIIGTAYFKDEYYDPDQGRTVSGLMYCKFATERTFAHVAILTNPQPLFGHNEIPIMTLRASVDGRDGLPYATLVRRRRGLERAATSTLRQMLRMTSSRGAIVNMSALMGESANLNTKDYLERQAKKLAQPTYMLEEWGETGSIRINEHTQDMAKLHEMLGVLSQMSDQTSGIHPAMRGQKSSVHSGTALDTVQQESMNVMDESARRLRYDLVVPLSNQLLSIIEQYGSQLALGGHHDPESNKLIQFGSDGDLTIAGNSAQYVVQPMVRGGMYTDDEREMLKHVMQGAPPELQMSLLLPYVRSLPNYSPQLFNDLKHLLMKQGVLLAPGMLTEEEAQMQEQMQAQQSKERQEQMELEKLKIMAEIEGARARSYSTVKKADEPTQGQKEMDLRATIARQQQQLMGG